MSKRWDNMVLKYGSEEAAKAEMRRRAEKSARNKGGTGGFAKLKQENPELLKELQEKGRMKRYGNIKQLQDVVGETSE